MRLQVWMFQNMANPLIRQKGHLHYRMHPCLFHKDPIILGELVFMPAPLILNLNERLVVGRNTECFSTILRKFNKVGMLLMRFRIFLVVYCRKISSLGWLRAM